MDNNTKEKFDETVKKVQEKAKTTTGKIVIAVIVVIILFNTMWTVMDGKVAGHIEALKKEFQAEDLSKKFAPFEERLTALESRSIDLDAVKSDVETIKQATESFETKLNAMIKAEEEKLESLTKDMESHKAYLERLKGLLAGEN